MGRSGYSDDIDARELAMYRGVVASATRGRRGQRFFKDLVTALDAMPVKRLITKELETKEGEVCVLGALGKHRGVNMEGLETGHASELGKAFDIATQLAREAMYENDEADPYDKETPEHRWIRVRAWAEKQIVTKRVA
jgi:hypothetical protein